jgi:hypothetical protein
MRAEACAQALYECLMSKKDVLWAMGSPSSVRVQILLLLLQEVSATRFLPTHPYPRFGRGIAVCIAGISWVQTRGVFELVAGENILI